MGFFLILTIDFIFKVYLPNQRVIVCLRSKNKAKTGCFDCDIKQRKTEKKRKAGRGAEFVCFCKST